MSRSSNHLIICGVYAYFLSVWNLWNLCSGVMATIIFFLSQWDCSTENMRYEMGFNYYFFFSSGKRYYVFSQNLIKATRRLEDHLHFHRKCKCTRQMKYIILNFQGCMLLQAFYFLAAFHSKINLRLSAAYVYLFCTDSAHPNSIKQVKIPNSSSYIKRLHSTEICNNMNCFPPPSKQHPSSPKEKIFEEVQD